MQLAEKIRNSMDKEYEPYWHVACGKNFGCYAIHEARRFMFFKTKEGFSFLIYKAG